MKIRFVWARAVVTAALILFAWAAFPGPTRLVAQEPVKPQPKLSEEEAKTANTINSAPDARAKLTAASEFLKKYPKSEARQQIAGYIAGQVNQVADPATKLALAEEFQSVFTGEEELELIRPVLIDAYVNANRVDDAFNVGTKVLAKDPENVYVLVQLTFAGTEEAKRRNAKYVSQSLEYGQKAIALIEADKRPANIEEANWANYKATLPQLYQQTGALQLISGKPEEAKAKLQKAIDLDPKEPSSYVLLGYVVNDEYLNLATAYKAMPDGAEKEATMKKIEGMMDNMIDLYARAVGLATGRAEYQSLIQQIMPDLTSYYKFRHNQSIDGLQQLIDKYKASGTP
jgi:tetratricopeptide (TPR) repeat protein